VKKISLKIDNSKAKTRPDPGADLAFGLNFDLKLPKILRQSLPLSPAYLPLIPSEQEETTQLQYINSRNAKQIPLSNNINLALTAQKQATTDNYGNNLNRDLVYVKFFLKKSCIKDKKGGPDTHIVKSCGSSIIMERIPNLDFCPVSEMSTPDCL